MSHRVTAGVKAGRTWAVYNAFLTPKKRESDTPELAATVCLTLHEREVLNCRPAVEKRIDLY